MAIGKTILLGLLVILALAFVAVWVTTRRRATEPAHPPSPYFMAVGFVTNFFDTLGIGSFATTTTIYRLFGGVDDRTLPGTLNVGHTLPSVAQALIYITIITVDFTTLVAMLGASVAGAWLGAGVVAEWERRTVRLAIGSALLVAAALMLMSVLGVVPVGGTAEGLYGWTLAVAVGGNFVLGALMTAGIGLYGPCLLLVSLLGMSPVAAFPIMMGSCAFLMPVGSVRFLDRGAYAHDAATGLTLGGLPGVLIAAFVVRSLPLDAVRWLVVAVATYAAITLLIAARSDGSDA